VAYAEDYGEQMQDVTTSENLTVVYLPGKMLAIWLILTGVKY
jgi:hypothetical protein